MKQVRPGTVMIRVLAVFFGLMTACASHRYFSEKLVIDSPKQTPAPAAEAELPEEPTLADLQEPTPISDGQLPTPAPAEVDTRRAGHVLYVRVEAEQQPPALGNSAR